MGVKMVPKVQLNGWASRLVLVGALSLALLLFYHSKEEEDLWNSPRSPKDLDPIYLQLVNNTASSSSVVEEEGQERNTLRDASATTFLPVPVINATAVALNVTIFSAAWRPSQGSRDPVDPDRYRQALLSWLRLSPTPRVVLLGNHPLAEEGPREYPDLVTVDPQIDANLAGEPLFHSLVARADQNQEEDEDSDQISRVSVMVRADTVLLPGFMMVLRQAAQSFPKWAVFGVGYEASLLGMSLKGQVNNVHFWAWNRIERSPLLRSSPIPPFTYGYGFHDGWLARQVATEQPGPRHVIDASLAGVSIAPKESTHTDSGPLWQACANADLAHTAGTLGVTTGEWASWQLLVCDMDSAHPSAIPQLCWLRQKLKTEVPSELTAADEKVAYAESCSPQRFGSKQRPWRSSVPGLPHTLDQLLPQVADKGKNVVMVGSTFNYKHLLMNFVCRARALGVHNLLVVAFDEDMYDYAFSHGLPVYLEHTASEGFALRNDSGCLYTSACFVQVSKLKSASVLRALQRGYNVLWSDTDIVWFEDIRARLEQEGANGTMLIQSDEASMNNPPNTKLNSGFYYVKSTTLTIRAFVGIVAKAMAKWRDSEQEGMNDELCGTRRERRMGRDECWHPEGLRVRVLNRTQFPNGFVFGIWNTYDARSTCQQRGCRILHNNWIVGKFGKMQRFLRHRLWSFDPDLQMCIHSWHPLASLSNKEFQEQLSTSLGIPKPGSSPPPQLGG